MTTRNSYRPDEPFRRETQRVSDTTTRRVVLRRSAAQAIAGVTAATLSSCSVPAQERGKQRTIQTVLGPVFPAELGATLMHEHAPTVDWSELWNLPGGPTESRQREMVSETEKLLESFHQSIPEQYRPGAIVEATPIRVGSYPKLLVDLANRTNVHIIASTGFWCEAMAPQHPWAIRMSLESDGIGQMARLFIREISQGMEDPTGAWGEQFTDVRVGIIKIGTSTYLRPTERLIHVAAAHANKETGCPITTHTTDAGGLEQATLLVEHGAVPQKIAIGPHGYRDDRANDEANEYHERLADMGVRVQFDRVGHASYPVDSQARQIKHLLDAGYAEHIFVSHDHVPYFYGEFTTPSQSSSAWNASNADFTVVTRRLVPELKKLGVYDTHLRRILVENPRDVLAFDAPS